MHGRAYNGASQPGWRCTLITVNLLLINDLYLEGRLQE
jgi:hypothetical protein